MQLNIVYQCMRDFENLANSKDIIRSLSEDIAAIDITKWVLPNYKIIARILSMGESISGRRALRKLANCFQLLICSYCCFRVAEPSKYLVDSLMSRFIQNDILTNKTKNSKLINQLYLKRGMSISKSELLKLHCKLIVLILNLKLKMAVPTNEDQSDVDAAHFFQMVGSVCLYLESLLNVFIAHMSTKESSEIKENLAFNQRYLNRTKSLPQQHVSEVLLLLTTETNEVQCRMRCLKMVIKELLRVLDDVQWSQMDDYVQQHDIHATTMMNRRLNIQSTLLVTGDLDLVAEFRLVRWPAWSKSS